MPIKAKDIASLSTEVFPEQIGDLSAWATQVLTPEQDELKDAVVFVSSSEQIQQCLDKGAKIILAPQPLPEGLNPIADTCVITYKNRSLAMSLALELFQQEQQWAQGEIHKSAIIGEGSKVASDVEIGPYTVIGQGVVIGSGTKIGPHCVIEDHVSIGTNTHLQSQVFIGRNCQIGSHCKIQSHATIGTDGYGYAPTPNGARRIPQIGIVVIEDHVEIGSQVAIDRATLLETRIGMGTKIDNLVHIAHNCTVGKHCLITAGFLTAGSSTFGDGFVCGGGVRVGDHISIAPGVQLAGATVVRQSIKEPGNYGGDPSQPMGDFIRTLTSLPHLPEIKKQLSRLLKKST